MADEKIVSDDPEKDIEGDTPKSDIKKGEEEPEKKPDDEEPEIPVRTATLQHIIARKDQKIRKLEAKNKAGEDDAGEDDEEELTPEAKTAVQREIERNMAPFRESAIKGETETMLNDLYSEEPEAKVFDKVIKRFISFEKNGVRPYEHIPPSVIYHHLAFGQAEAKGANKKSAADLEANLSRNKGRGNRPKSTKTESGLPSIEEMESMDKKDFQKIINSAMN